MLFPLSPTTSSVLAPPRAPSLRRTYRHEAIKLEAKPKGLKRIKKALNLGPKEEEGEESIEVAV
jgi:hypothetical protein